MDVSVFKYFCSMPSLLPTLRSKAVTSSSRSLPSSFNQVFQKEILMSNINSSSESLIILTMLIYAILSIAQVVQWWKKKVAFLFLTLFIYLFMYVFCLFLCLFLSLFYLRLLSLLLFVIHISTCISSLFSLAACSLGLEWWVWFLTIYCRVFCCCNLINLQLIIITPNYSATQTAAAAQQQNEQQRLKQKKQY